MHSVDLIEEALRLAEAKGIEVRREWLGESLGGVCRVGKRWLLFANLSLAADEQLPQVIAALQKCGVVPVENEVSPQLRQLIRQ